MPECRFDQTAVELRPIFESEDFGQQLTPEPRAQAQRIGEPVAARSRNVNSA